MIGGVCGGLGRYLAIDPIIFRIVLPRSPFSAASGCCSTPRLAVVAEDGTRRLRTQRLFRGRPTPAHDHRRRRRGRPRCARVDRSRVSRRAASRPSCSSCLRSSWSSRSTGGHQRTAAPHTGTAPYAPPPAPPYSPPAGGPTPPHRTTAPSHSAVRSSPHRARTPQYAASQYSAPQLHGAVGTAGRLLALPPTWSNGDRRNRVAHPNRRSRRARRRCSAHLAISVGRRVGRRAVRTRRIELDRP